MERRGVVLVLVEVVLQTSLVWYSAGHAVDRGRGYEVFPVVVVVGARLCVEGGWEGGRVDEVKGIGRGEEVVELLVLHVAEDGLAIVVVGGGRAVEEVVGEGVCSASVCSLCAVVGKRTAKRRRVLVVHGGSWEAPGRSTREPRERLMRQRLQLGGG